MCAIFGEFSPAIWSRNVSPSLVTALNLLQPRGQEGCGIVTHSKSTGDFYQRRFAGRVESRLTDEKVLAGLPGSSGIGHLHYKTGKVKDEPGASPQPYFSPTFGFGIAHNGEITNSAVLRNMLISRGINFNSESDTEVIFHLIAISKKETIPEKVEDACCYLEGAYSLVFIYNEGIIGVRDPQGIRPLLVGKSQTSYLLSSESTGLEKVGAIAFEDVLPGDMVVINEEGVRVKRITTRKVARHFCSFEIPYYSGPNAVFENRSMYKVRKALGALLANEHPVDADFVIGVPDSSLICALGYSQELGIPFEFGLSRAHYGRGRTFIEPSPQQRNYGTELKHDACWALLNGKSVAVVDDSIVRGTTSRHIVSLLRKKGGAKKVHFLSGTPPVTGSCPYGTDTKKINDLIAHTSGNDVEAIRKEIDADYLGYLSIDGYKAVIHETRLQEDELPYAPVIYSPQEKLERLSECGKLDACVGCHSGMYRPQKADKVFQL